MNYQIPEMKFKDLEGKQRVVRGMHTYLNQVVSFHNMRSILRHGDIEWAAKCFITSPKPNINIVEHPREIKQLLHKYESVFGDLPPTRPPDKGVEHIIVLEVDNSPIQMLVVRLPLHQNPQVIGKLTTAIFQGSTRGN